MEQNVNKTSIGQYLELSFDSIEELGKANHLISKFLLTEPETKLSISLKVADEYDANQTEIFITKLLNRNGIDYREFRLESL